MFKIMEDFLFFFFYIYDVCLQGCIKIITYVGILTFFY